MWRRLIDGYSGYTCAQYINAAYRAPKGFYDKARLCEGGTIRVRKGCVIYEGEEVLFNYGKAYWDRWGGDNELKSPQERQATRGTGGDEEQRRGGKRPAGGDDDTAGAKRRAQRAGGSAAHAGGEGAGEKGCGEVESVGGERVVRREVHVHSIHGAHRLGPSSSQCSFATIGRGHFISNSTLPRLPIT